MSASIQTWIPKCTSGFIFTPIICNCLSEKGLADFCIQQGYTVISGRQKTAATIVEKFHPENKLAKKIHRMAGTRPDFIDYVDEVLNKAIPNRKKFWRPYFDALVVVRNKSLHSDVLLSESERAKLKRGGLGVMVSNDGSLQLNTRQYKQVVDYVLQFFSETAQTV